MSNNGPDPNHPFFKGGPISAFTFPGAFEATSFITHKPRSPTTQTTNPSKLAPNIVQPVDPRTSADLSTEAVESLIDGLPQQDVGAFLRGAPRGAPNAAADPAGYALWCHLIQLKTRSLELEIADARRKEREAEVELAKLRNATGQDNLLAPPITTSTIAGPSLTSSGGDDTNLPSLSGFPYGNLPSSSTQAPTTSNIGMFNYDTPVQFDLDALLQDGDLGAFLDSMPGTIDPSSLYLSSSTANAIHQQTSPLSGFATFPESANYPTFEDTEDKIETSPLKRRASSVDSVSSTHPPKKTKKTEKKSLVEQNLTCGKCEKPLGRMMLRAPKSHSPASISPDLYCFECRPIQLPTPLEPIGGSTIGTVETRKRARPSIEQEEHENPVSQRMYCDVCQRSFTSGTIKDEKQESLSTLTELICDICDNKYQRCTDCGGGGGPRIGIGKWRMKQLFHTGRKTCSLNHSRIGDRTREIAVHVTPTDFSAEQLDHILARCKTLWTEKNFARLAVPDMLEIDLPPTHANPLKDFSDVEAVVHRNWPTRESMIRATGVDSSQFKRILGLIWAHAKPRRTVHTVDLEVEGDNSRAAHADAEEDNSTVIANVKRTIPAGSDLIGMWGGEWDMLHGSILISNFVPFEGTDGEDSTALSVGEIVTKVQLLHQSINAERESIAQKRGNPAELLPVPQHLWTVSTGSIPLLRERMADILIKKRSFVLVDEYLTRHPEFIHALKARPLGLHPTLTGKEGDRSNPLILVRWLGTEFDPERMFEIKQKEFGGKSKIKKKSRTKS